MTMIWALGFRQAISAILQLQRVRQVLEDPQNNMYQLVMNILKETDTPEKHKHDILTIHMMRREFEVFDSALKALPTKEHDIVFTFINKERKMLEIAEDRDLAYQTVKNLIGDIKKLLESRTVPYFRETL